MNTVFIEDMEVGLSRSRRKTISRRDIDMFGALSGDRNPLHFDDAYAEQTRFGGVVAHGMLSASLISGVLGEELPGHGAVYLEQSVKFCAPVRPGDTVETVCTIAEIDETRRRVRLDCVCRVGDQVVLEGSATVLAPRRDKSGSRKPAVSETATPDALASAAA